MCLANARALGASEGGDNFTRPSFSKRVTRIFSTGSEEWGCGGANWLAQNQFPGAWEDHKAGGMGMEPACPKPNAAMELSRRRGRGAEASGPLISGGGETSDAQSPGLLRLWRQASIVERSGGPWEGGSRFRVKMVKSVRREESTLIGALRAEDSREAA